MVHESMFNRHALAGSCLWFALKSTKIPTKGCKSDLALPGHYMPSKIALNFENSDPRTRGWFLNPRKLECLEMALMESPSSFRGGCWKNPWRWKDLSSIVIWKNIIECKIRWELQLPFEDLWKDVCGTNYWFWDAIWIFKNDSLALTSPINHG